VVSYRDDFDFLWELIGGTQGHDPAGTYRDSGRCTFILVWDAMPPVPQSSSVNTNKYLTPFDWTVAYSLSSGRGGIRREGSGFDFRILILDLASQASADADAVRFFAQFPGRNPPSMPWVRVFDPIGERDRLWAATSDPHILPLAVMADLADHRLPFFSECSTANRDADLTMIQRIWCAGVAQPAQPNDRHALANLVGPFLLKRGQTAERSVRSIRTLLEQLQLVPTRGDEQCLLAPGRPWIRWQEEPWKTAVDRILQWEERPLNVVVADDNVFEYGWGELLCMAMDAEPVPTVLQATGPVLLGRRDAAHSPMRLYGVESAEQLVERADILPAHESDSHDAECNGDEHRPSCGLVNRRFQLSLRMSDGQELPLDILLLDLRLHQGKDLASEARFFESLLPGAANCCVSEQEAGQSPAVSSWPGFTRDELDRVAAWATEVIEGSGSARREDARYLRALTLLPRLMSLVDPSLPIVLFSSTGQREIVEALRPYGNIITAFEKPRLSANPDPGLAAATAAKFRDAMLAALDLVLARRVCIRLPESSSFGSAAHTYEWTVDERPWRIELMLDETGDVDKDTLKLGGLLTVCPPGVELGTVDRELHRRHPWIRVTKEHCRREQQRAEIAELLLRSCEKESIYVAAVSLAGKRSDSQSHTLDRSDELDDVRIADNLYRELFRCIVEMAVYYLGRQRVPEGARTEFAVRAAARHIPLPADPQAAGRLRRALFERWGMTTEYVGPDMALWTAKDEIDEFLEQGPAVEKRVIDAARAFSDYVDFEVEHKKLTRPTASVRYFRWDTPRAIVEAVKRQYHNSAFEPRPGIVRAYSLNAYGKPAAFETWAMHFFADGLLSAGGNADLATQELWKNGFQSNYGVPLLMALEAHRLWLRSLVVEALATYSRVEGSARSDPVIGGIGHGLHRACASLSGAEILRLARRLSEPTHSLAPPRESVGRVRWKYRDRLEIVDNVGGVFWARKEDCSENFDRFSAGDEVSFMWLPSVVPGDYVARQVRRH